MVATDGPLWTDKDIARLIGSTVGAVRVERSTAKREGREPNLPPAVRIGSRLRYVPAVVSRWIEAKMEPRGRELVGA